MRAVGEHAVWAPVPPCGSEASEIALEGWGEG